MEATLRTGFIMLFITAGCCYGSSPPPESSGTGDVNEAAVALHNRLRVHSGEDVIQAGLTLLPAIEALRELYVAGLDERSLISYLSLPANRPKFDSYWKKMSDDWFDRRIPACREFANWEQFVGDRIWVKVAAAAIAERDDSGLTDAQAEDVFGHDWLELSKLRADQTCSEPPSPRAVNPSGAERYKHLMGGLYRKHGLDAGSDSFEKLRRQLHQETVEKLIQSPSGLRRKIFMEYHADFATALDKLASDNQVLVKLVTLRAGRDALPGFESTELDVLSNVWQGRAPGLQQSQHRSTAGRVSVDRGATLDGEPAYLFSIDGAVELCLARTEPEVNLEALDKEIADLEVRIATLQGTSRANADATLAQIRIMRETLHSK